MSALGHSSHVCCAPPLRHVCCITQQTSLLCHTAESIQKSHYSFSGFLEQPRTSTLSASTAACCIPPAARQPLVNRSRPPLPPFPSGRLPSLATRQQSKRFVTLAKRIQCLRQIANGKWCSSCLVATSSFITSRWRKQAYLSIRRFEAAFRHCLTVNILLQLRSRGQQVLEMLKTLQKIDS